MKLIKKAEAVVLQRPFDRKTYELLAHELPQAVSSIVFYLSDLPTGRFDEHHHAVSEEIIFFPKGGKMRINGDVYVFEEWDGVLLEPGDRHGSDLMDRETVHLAIKMPNISDKLTT